MTDYSELIVVILLLPVVMQVILPLLLLVGFGLASAIKAVTRLRRDTPAQNNNIGIGEQLQLSRN